MILEVVEIKINPGEQAAFENAMNEALQTVTAHAEGASSYSFIRCVESSDRYLLTVTWDKVEDHMVTYRQSAPRDRWLALVSRFFKGAPHMEHFEIVTQAAWK